MPHRDWTFRIRDILEAIDAIRNYTDGMNFEDFVADRKTVDAVVRNLTVIGEAAGRIPKDIGENHPEIPWREMGDIRNFIVHEYFGISNRILWDTIQADLPPLIPLLQKVLASQKRNPITPSK